MGLNRNLNQDQFGERNFEVHEGKLHVGGKPYPLAQVTSKSVPEGAGGGSTIHSIRVPTESGWTIRAHLLNDAEDQPKGQSGHVMGPTVLTHEPTVNAYLKGGGNAIYIPGGGGQAATRRASFHEYPEGTPNTDVNSQGRRTWKTVTSPQEFHELVDYASKLPGGSKPRG
jgi:hypothetical protein